MMKTASKFSRHPSRLAYTASLLLAACLVAAPAEAQYVMEFAQTYNAPTSNFVSNTFLNQQALINAATTRLDASQANRPQPPLAAPQAERNAAELAQAAPAAQRAKLEKIYVQPMPGYQQLELKLGWPADDVAGAMAALLAGNYMAMLGTFMALANKTSQQQPAPVVANLRQSARANLRVVVGDAVDTLRFTAGGLQLR
jgi:hypothetical protein